MTIRERYRRNRAEQPTMPAKWALEWARSEDARPTYDWQEGRGNESARLELSQDGFDIRVSVRPDFDYNITDWIGTFTDSWEPL